MILSRTLPRPYRLQSDAAPWKQLHDNALTAATA